jgi:hypothetical protein
MYRHTLYLRNFTRNFQKNTINVNKFLCYHHFGKCVLHRECLCPVLTTSDNCTLCIYMTMCSWSICKHIMPVYIQTYTYIVDRVFYWFPTWAKTRFRQTFGKLNITQAVVCVCLYLHFICDAFIRTRLLLNSSHFFKNAIPLCYYNSTT